MPNQDERIDYAGLAALLAGARESRGLRLREVAEVTRVSPSTLSRIERQDVRPDIRTIQTLVDWLGIPLSRVVVQPLEPRANAKKARSKKHSLDDVEVQFRADPKLSPKAAEALISIMRTAYKGLADKSPEG